VVQVTGGASVLNPETDHEMGRSPPSSSRKSRTSGEATAALNNGIHIGDS
jgi:hypothetical protein